MTTESFWTFARRHPDHLSIIDAGGGELRAGQLLSACNQVVHALRRLGLARGDGVAVVLRNRPELLEVFLAAMQAGWFFTPVHTRLAMPELRYVLADCEAKAVVVDASTATAVEQARSELPGAGPGCFDVEQPEGPGSYRVLKGAQPDSDPVDRSAGESMFYTSGTTGRPKAVRRPMMSGSPEQRAAQAVMHLKGAAGIEPNSGQVHLVCSPLHHSASLLWCGDQLQVGHTVVLMDKWDPEVALEKIARHRVTAAFMVPTHFSHLLALPEAVRRRYDVSSLRHVAHSGAPCPVDVKRRMLEWWGPVIHETYAATEGVGTAVGPTEWLAHPGTVGKAGRNVQVLRDDGSACAPLEVGQIYLSHVRRPFEYWKDAGKTAGQRRGTFFTLGDLGYVDAEGYLFLSGRTADVIISGGVNIYPAEVEAVLLEHPQVADAAVFGVPHADRGEQVLALIQPATGVEPGASLATELQAFCAQRLAPFKCPRQVEFVGELPRDATGKLSRRRLREPYWAGTGRTM